MVRDGSLRRIQFIQSTGLLLLCYWYLPFHRRPDLSRALSSTYIF